MRVLAFALALCALLVVVESCARGPCRPLRAPRATPLASREDAGPDVCDVGADDATQCPPSVTSWQRKHDEWSSPRCASDDPDCGPQLVRGSESCFRTQAARKPYNPSRVTTHHCSSDGECSYRCDLCMRFGVDHYPCPYHFIYEQIPPAPPPDPLADPWGGTFPVPTWCGCVEGQCGFFTQ